MEIAFAPALPAFIAGVFYLALWRQWQPGMNLESNRGILRNGGSSVQFAIEDILLPVPLGAFLESRGRALRRGGTAISLRECRLSLAPFETEC
jgi:hypothetical protein